jgi:hypothetical protein
MSEEEGTGEEGEGIGGRGTAGVVASESRPSKIVPPLVKCIIIITNRNSINE